MDEMAGPNVQDDSLFRKKKNCYSVIFYSKNPFLDLRGEDNLSIVDKMAGPNVSFIQRFHFYIMKRTTSL